MNEIDPKDEKPDPEEKPPDQDQPPAPTKPADDAPDQLPDLDEALK